MADEFCNSDLNALEKDIEEFQYKWQLAHGEKSMTANMHSLVHAVQSIRKAGPYWGTSAFGPESNMSKFKRNVHSAKGVSGRISDHILDFYEQKNKLAAMSLNADPCFDFCNKLIYKTKEDPMNYVELPDNVRVSIQDLKKKFFLQCTYEQTILHSKLYQRSKNVDNTLIELKDGLMGQIEYTFT